MSGDNDGLGEQRPITDQKQMRATKSYVGSLETVAARASSAWRIVLTVATDLADEFVTW